MCVEQENDWQELPEKAILVVAATDDSMLVHLHRAQGIIAEQPGLTSHAAIIGRKLQYSGCLQCAGRNNTL